ncbi:Zn2/Cys6 DNA-binding protein [Glarea lozoyensis ATCC 20868]|uniref:Zn2/Cys6 DNA-binding protein n=1 Tax=Glarea lozoyensis (strain ATCC 20868 / MF5171) TaxID=1116229 RepID=S3DTT6_GLAL2|nr:Zn2/Cys6 DNA-binding protein [Glarea lozoyensis ATCC 20868]EPE29783.1 Zn2/Cys6 DNA-binding protein [Glarea lozoyensis ATCC 20868]
MLASPSATPESAPPAYTPASKITRGHSCVLCQQRKVRCDRQKPCSNCVKARVECIASIPTLARRRRQKTSETDVMGKLKRYEQLLKTHGVKIDEDEEGSRPSEEPTKATCEVFQPQPPRSWDDRTTIGLTAPRPPNAETGTLFIHKEEAHYVENTLWENLKEEIADTKDDVTDHSSSEDESNEGELYPEAELFLLGHMIPSRKLTEAHPQPVHIFRLWQTFLNNVNPLITMFHAPTVQQLILDAAANLKTVSRPVEALMFSIYLLAVTSLEDSACESMFGESQASLIRKYSRATHQALVNSKFLKSLNLYTLQAYVYYLLGVRKYYDAHSIWVLTGSAVRIAQRLGLHRDGSRWKISVFDAEMRRRTWWTIIFLDGHASKLAGAGFPSWLINFDTKIPLNLSDSDLNPEMKILPEEKVGATEMMFSCMRYEVAAAIRRAGAFATDGIGTVFDKHSDASLIGKKDAAIDELDKTFKEKYLKYCDPSIPLHIVIKHMASSVIASMRLMAHHPRQYPDKGASMPQSERDMLFQLSITELEIDNLGYTIKAIRGFVWQISQYFQEDGFIFLLGELRVRLTGEDVDRAWRLVKATYEYHTDMIDNMKNPLYVAIGNLCLKAWRRREEAGLTGLTGYESETPQFIKRLRELRKGSEIAKPGAPSYNFGQAVPPAQYAQVPNYNPQNSATVQNMLQDNANQFANIDLDLDVEMPEINSVDWEYWQTLFDGDSSYDAESGSYFN